jgi:hypothetical protein
MPDYLMWLCWEHVGTCWARVQNANGTWARVGNTLGTCWEHFGMTDGYEIATYVGISFQNSQNNIHVHRHAYCV